MKTKRTVTVSITTMCLIVLVGLTGCGEEFAAGFGTGAVAMQKMSEDARERFIEAVNKLNKETERLNTEISAVKDIDIETFVKPETAEAIKSLKGREKDPMTWVALASVLGAAFFGGKVHEKKKVLKNES